VIVKCVKKHLDKNNFEKYKCAEQFKNEQNITIDKEYLVIGINIYQGAIIYGTGIYVQILNDDKIWAQLPIDLFEIRDKKVSKHWEASKTSESEFSICPREFNKEYFYDDLTEMVPEVVKLFRGIYTKLEEESK
jgi:hypothetical protein